MPIAASGADVAVIGGGIAGASAAYELASDADVVVVEREATCDVHATGRSAAVFAPSYGNDVVRALTLASRTFFEDPPPAFASDSLLHPRPLLLPIRPEQVALGEELQALTPRLERVSPLVAEYLCPILDAATMATALVDPQSSDIDVNALHQGYLTGARARGARVLVSSGVIALSRHGERWTVHTADQTIEAGVVVDAAGAWGDEVARLAGVAPVGLQPLRRTVMLFGAPAGSDPRSWPLVLDPEERFYFRPEGMQLMGSAADETPSEPCDARAEQPDIALAVERILEATTLKQISVTGSWAGLRTFVPDRSPVIGFDRDVPGWFWLVGQGGFGIQTAPAAGQLAASLLTGGGVPEALVAAGVGADHVSPARLRPR